jgi:hypothetical protein
MGDFQDSNILHRHMMNQVSCQSKGIVCYVCEIAKHENYKSPRQTSSAGKQNIKLYCDSDHYLFPVIIAVDGGASSCHYQRCRF